MKLFILCLMAASVPVALSVRVASKDSSAAITVQAAGRGGQALNFRDGRAMRVEYRGDQFSIQALQSGTASARAVASVDLDDNGTPDLLAGYANNGSGIVTVQRGNTDAFAPVDDSVFARMRAGYNPDSLSSIAEIHQVPEPADFVATGDFNQDAVKDVLVAARGGGAYLLAGDGEGGLGEPTQIVLPGTVTAVAAAEFGMSDGKADLAVGVFGSEGPSLLLFPSAEGGLSAPLSFPLKAEATSIQFGNLDQDPFLDVAVAAGNEIEIIHGWGRKNFTNAQSRVETIDAPNTLRGLALGNFIWDRENRTEIAAQSADGTVSILQLGNLDTRSFSPEEVAVRVRMRGKVTKQTDAEVLAAASWSAGKVERWSAVKDFAVTGVVGGADSSQGLLVSSHISWQKADELLVLDAEQNRLKIVHQADAGTLAVAGSATDDFSTISLDVTSAPVAVTALPRKINGERDLVLLGSGQAAATMIPLAPTATFTVTKTTDGNDGTCNADCSLREAVAAANGVPGSTIQFGLNGTFQLTINGTAEGGFCQSPGTGDLDISANNTTITGAGAANTIIQQTQPNDRVLCVDQALAGNFTFNMSGVTITGGRETFAVGGGGMVSGAANDNTTVSSSTFSNNQETGASGPGGGGINNLGGSLTVTNCTVGGTSAPGASQLVVAQANSCNVAGGGLSHSPGDPLGGASNGVLTVTGTTFQNNTAASGASGGGGADVFTHNLGTGSHSFATSTFLSNKATVGNGGGIIVESLTCTVATTAFTSNAAQGASSHGGGIQVTGGALVLNGTSPTITFSGNTATIAGSSVTAGSTVNVSGTNTTIGGDIEIPTNGTWTNNAGSALSPTNVVITGGTFNMNNSTMTVTGNLSLGPGPAVGGTFNGNTGTVNIAGNFTGTAGGAPATAFNAGTGTFNFNGGGAQSIGGSLSPTFNNLTVNKGGGSLTLGVNVGVASNLTVTAGTFDLSTFTANRTAVGGTLTVSNGATLRFQSATLPTNYSAYTLGATSTVEYYGSGAQTITAVNYGHLTSSNTGARTLANAGTIGIAGVFTPGTNAYTITGSTIDFNGSVAQTIPAFNYNNLTSSNTGARTLANAGTVGVAGVFTPGANAYTITGSTINFNGSGGQTIPAFNYNNLTSSSTGARTLANAGTIGIAGIFTPGTNVYTITGSTIDFNGSGAQTISAFNYNNLTSSNTGARTLANAGTIGIAGVFTQGTNAYTITGSTIDFNGSGAQTIPAFNYNNLTSSNTGARTLANAGTIGVAGVFTPGTNVYTITGSTIDFNGSGAQTISAFTYNNLTSSNTGSRTLANPGTISVAGVFTPGTNVYVITGSTINFNGGGAQTIPAFNYNNLTSSSTGARTLANAGTIGVAGVFTPGTNVYTITGSTINFNGSGAQTIPAFNYNNLTSSNTGARTLANAGTIGVAGVFTPGTNAYTVTGSTINFNGAGSQNIPGFTYNNLTSSGGGVARILDPVNTIKIAGTFTPGADLYTVTGSTIEYNGGAAQSLPVGFTPYNNLTFNNPTTVTGGPATLDVNGNLQITQGTFAVGGSLSITVAGNWINNGGTFSPSTGDVTFDGGVGQSIGGTTATTFNNLSVGNASGLAMNNSNTVNGNLALVGSDITVSTVGPQTLIQPNTGTSSGSFDVNGRLQRTGIDTAALNTTFTFGNPNNQITVTAGTRPANIVVDLTRSVPTGGQGFPTAVQRYYTITPSAAGFTGTLRLRYLETELNGNVEGPNFIFRRFNGTGWAPVLPTSTDFVNNWLQATGVTTFSPWTFNSTFTPTASNGVITGRIVDSNGAPVEGAVVRLAGTQNRKFITDANGVYRFENVETNGFYTVTPSRANYSFSPAERSFSQIGQATEATFGATAASNGLVNPLDTPEYFVRQHYIDFLGREPDEAGFNFWSDQILGCGNDNQCIDRKRENVSAAYFLSIEFQQTGGLVDGMYRASYGVTPQYAAFLPDVRQVAGGVIVGADNWEAKLAANKEAFVNAFASRPAFHQLYDSMDNSLFVDTLIQHTGASFTAAERDALVTGLGTGTMTRGEALRSIAENQSFVNAKFNQAFVMMEYFGYLRRDADSGGYAFWLDKLNSFGGNFEKADMVKAFIVSGEYRDRFPR